MEFTQPLELTQTQTTHTERICAEQIGFLGILGTKYPVKRGPNKIGRDPSTCNIVLNLNSISRQHAVINVLSGQNFMLMDLDSANKTRLNNKHLPAYIPVPLSNGDTVQFGEVFGIFRLLEEETDLPCTQALDIPDTPLPGKFASRVRHATVPESPDVSDKDDSFIVPSQPKPDHRFKNANNKFIKSSSKTISIQPIGTNKIDNIYWNSSKKSDSFNLDDSNSLNESLPDVSKDKQPLGPVQNDSTDSLYTAETQLPPSHIPSIHSQATQLPDLPSISKSLDQNDANKENDCSAFDAETKSSVEKENGPVNLKEDDIFNASTQLPSEVMNKNKENIFEAETQLPYDKANSDEMFEADTQLPPGYKKDINIHELETQLPFPDKDDSPNPIFSAETQVPTVTACPFVHSQDRQLPNVSSKTDVDIHDGDTQFIQPKPTTSIKNDDDDIFNAETPLPNNKIVNDSLDKDTSVEKSKHNLDKSNEIILFDEVEAKSFLDEDFHSQPILGTSAPKNDSEEIPLSQSDTITDDDFEIRLEESKTQSKPTKRNVRVTSGESTDCEDLEFLSPQKIPEKKNDGDVVTDSEGNEIDGKKTNQVPLSSFNANVDDLPMQIIPDAPASSSKVNFEDLATQVIPEINANDNVEANNKTDEEPNAECFEDMLTQVIPEIDTNKETSFEDLPTQVIAEDVPKKSTTKDLTQQYSDEVVASPFKVPFPTPVKPKRKDTKSNELKDTKEKSVVGKTKSVSDDGDEKYYAATQDIIDDLCSQPDFSAETRTENNKIQSKDGTMTPSHVESHKGGGSFPHLEGEIEITVNKVKQVNKSSSSDADEKLNNFVTSVDVAKPTKVPSDPSDGEVTPKKVRPRKLLETLLPDSQEIKTSVMLSTKTDETESSSESEQEKDSQDQTPILHKKKRSKAKVKKDLTEKFDMQALPTRIITRTRKPTAKIQESCDLATQKRNKNIFKPKFLNDSEQDDVVDTEIISENITRLRTKNDKKNHKDDVKIKEVPIKRKSDEVNLDATKQKSVQEIKNTSKNDYSQDVVVDLTEIEDGDKTRSSRKNDKAKNKDNTVDKKKSEDIKSQAVKNKHAEDRKNKSKNNYSQDVVVDLTEIENGDKTRSRRKVKNKEHTVDTKKTDEPKNKTDKNESKESKQVEKSKKNHAKQDKITNYTVSTENSKKSPSIADANESRSTMDTTNSNKSAQHDKTKDIKVDKPVTEELERTKRKRGRPKKEEEQNKIDTKETKKQKKDENLDTKRRKKDDSSDTKKIQKDEIKPTEPEIRRSRRQRTVKENSQNSQRNHEKSTVYHRSSESSFDSPKRKRMDNVIDVAPSPKRTRSMTATSSANSSSTTNSTLSLNSTSLRSTPSRASHQVLLTGFACDIGPIKVHLEKLGATVVSEVSACTVLLTPELKRTFKLLCAVGLGRPIVGPHWVQASVDSGAVCDPWQYLLQDVEKESRFRFSLSGTLSGPRNYLKGYYVSVTPAVQPKAVEMKQIVECSGGVWVQSPSGPHLSYVTNGRWVVVTCAADRALHNTLRGRGAILVSTEFILTGVLRQQLDLDTHRLP